MSAVLDRGVVRLGDLGSVVYSCQLVESNGCKYTRFIGFV